MQSPLHSANNVIDGGDCNSLAADADAVACTVTLSTAVVTDADAADESL